jgi:hypothetical protein
MQLYTLIKAFEAEFAFFVKVEFAAGGQLFGKIGN